MRSFSSTLFSTEFSQLFLRPNPTLKQYIDRLCTKVRPGCKDGNILRENPHKCCNCMYTTGLNWWIKLNTCDVLRWTRLIEDYLSIFCGDKVIVWLLVLNFALLQFDGKFSTAKFPFDSELFSPPSFCCLLYSGYLEKSEKYRIGSLLLRSV